MKSRTKTFAKSLVLVFLALAPSLTGQAYAGNDHFDPKFFSLNDIIYYDASDEQCITKGSATLSGKDNAEKIWKFFRGLGYSEEATASILGNFEVESGVNPKKYESDYLWPDKYDTMKDGATVEGLGISWGEFAGAYKGTIQPQEPLYLFDGKHYIGVGLGQWTSGRSYMLSKFAKDNNLDIWDVGTQLKFMMEADSRKDFMESFKSFKGSVQEASATFQSGWIGNSTGTAERASNSQVYYDQFKGVPGEASSSPSGGSSQSNSSSKITFIGDSITNSVKSELESAFSGSSVSAVDGRGINQKGLNSGESVMDYLSHDASNLNGIVVINIGTNDSFPTDQAKAMLDKIGKDKKIFLVNNYSKNENTDYGKTNANIQSVVKDYENVKILDWKSYVDQNGGRAAAYSQDNVHFSDTGKSLYVKFLKEQLANSSAASSGCSSSTNWSGKWGTNSDVTRTTEDGFPIYIQWDPRWAQEKWSNDGMNMQNYACGPTSMAMILTAFGQPKNPLDLAKEIQQKSPESVLPGGGTTYKVVDYVAKTYNLKSQIISPTVDEINKRLDNKELVIAAGSGGAPFLVSGGHWVIIRARTSNGKWLVANPNSHSAEEDMQEFDPGQLSSMIWSDGAFAVGAK